MISLLSDTPAPIAPDRTFTLSLITGPIPSVYFSCSSLEVSHRWNFIPDGERPDRLPFKLVNRCHRELIAWVNPLFRHDSQPLVTERESDRLRGELTLLRAP